MKINLDSFAITHKGLHRRLNEDAYLCKPELGLFLVSDGMGGANCGDLASSLTKDFFENGITPYILDPDATVPFERKHDCHLLDALEYIAIETNRTVQKIADEKPECRGMGATLTAVVVEKDWLNIVHVGDSRLYSFSNSNLEQLTEDHTRVHQMVKMNMITEEQVQAHPMRHIITQCIGCKSKLQPDVMRIEIIPETVYLLCSDGLYDMIDYETLTTIMTDNSRLENLGNALVDAANQNGGRDNITVVLFRQSHSGE